MALSKLAKRRLTKLIDYMAKLPKSANKHFDMTAWFHHWGDHQLRGNVTRQILQDCGTSACALGWACTIPSFRKAGLVMDIENPSEIYVSGKADKFFGLHGSQSAELFDMYTETPKEWAREARSLLREWERA